MVAVAAKVMVGEGHEPVLQVIFKHPPFSLQGFHGNVHHIPDLLKKFFLILCPVADSRKVYRYHSYAARLVCCPEKAAHLASQLLKVKLQPAAHAPYIRW